MSYKVTIAIPIYNVEEYIERCARSVFEQTFDSIQYVFINDCTSDNSVGILKKIIEEYPHRKNDITIINHDKNRGLAAARATAINAAEGEFILNIDSDDYVEYNMVQLMYKKACDEDADIVVCDIMMDWGKATKFFYQAYHADNREYTKLLVSKETMPYIVSKLIRLSLHKQNNIMPLEGINMGEDYVITTRLAYFARKISKVDYAFYYYWQKNENSYTKNFSSKHIDNFILCLDTVKDFFSNIPDQSYYRESLLKGLLREKILLLVCSNRKDRKRLAKLFPETNSVLNETNLKSYQKITITLANRNLFGCLSLFLFLLDHLIQFKQLLKGFR